MSYASDTLNEFGKPVSDFTSTIAPRRAAMEGRQQGQETDYLSRFRGAIMGQEALPHMYSRIGRELNMPNLATNFNQVSNQMTNLPETYSKATRGFDVNANQLNRIVSTKQAALAPALTTATQNYQTAQDQQNKMIGAELTQQEKQLRPFETEQQFMADRFARESTGFTQDNEMELNSLISKMQAGVQLSEGEKQRANELAIQEKKYQEGIRVAEIKASADRYGYDEKAKTERDANLIALAGNY